MTFDHEGRAAISPRLLLENAVRNARGLVDHCLISATPAVFTHAAFCDFLHAVSIRVGVHPRNLILRGSCQIGFSITPRIDKAWMRMDDQSDLDLAIVDAGYYERIESEVMRWEDRTRAHHGEGMAAERYGGRQRDRFYNCCRAGDLPRHLVAHHVEAMEEIAEMRLSGPFRAVKAFLFRDWWSLRSRYVYDLEQLRRLVPHVLPEPGDQPMLRVR